MKVLLSWLRDFAPIEGDPVELGEHLSDLGMAVEQLDVLGEGLDGIVVARVLATRPHPDADRIHLVDVDAGDGEALQIACGAFNMAAGDLVPLATVGTVMPDGMEIGRRKMRGEWSNGMLCSPRELGLGERRTRASTSCRPACRWARRFAEALGIERRRPLRPRDQPQPPRRHVGGRRGPRPGGPPAACRSPCPEPAVDEVARRTASPT